MTGDHQKSRPRSFGIVPIVASLLSLNGVSLVAHFEVGGRLSIRRKHEMKTGKNNCRGQEV